MTVSELIEELKKLNDDNAQVNILIPFSHDLEDGIYSDVNEKSVCGLSKNYDGCILIDYS